MSDFFAATVGINQEFIAENGLKAKGLEPYCPKGRKIIRHARKEMLRIFPVISRYIFVKMETAEDFQAIRSTDGIINILSNNGKPVAIPAVEIERLRESERLGEFNIIPDKRKKRQRPSKGFEILKNLLSPFGEIQI